VDLKDLAAMFGNKGLSGKEECGAKTRENVATRKPFPFFILLSGYQMGGATFPKFANLYLSCFVEVNGKVTVFGS